MDENVEKLVRAIATHGEGKQQGHRGVSVEALCEELGIGVAALRDIVELNWPLFDSVQSRKTMAGLVAVGLSPGGRQAAYDLNILPASPLADAEAIRKHLASVGEGHVALSSDQLEVVLGIGQARLRDAVDLLDKSGQAKAQHVVGGAFHVSLRAEGRAEAKLAVQDGTPPRRSTFLNGFPGKECFSWQALDGPPDEDSVHIAFHVASLRRAERRATLAALQQCLTSNPVAWLDTGKRMWTISVPLLRSACPWMGEYKWLGDGDVMVEPEFEDREKEVFGLRRYEGVISLHLTPETLVPNTAADEESGGVAGPEDHRFKLEALLGEGTAGEVWRAHDVVLNRRVAIKFVTATNAGNDALAHARALARVSHPNIVSVFEITQLTHPTSGSPSSVVVMELVEGTPLVECIGPSMSRDEARRVGCALVDALEAYHLAGLAHLDVHDGNVMVSATAVKMLDPLYYETDLFRSTATREKQQARDIREARGVLVQIVHGGAISIDAANTFERVTAKPSLALLRAELEKAAASNEQQPNVPRSTSPPAHVGAVREQVLHGVYKRLRQVHKTTLALIHLVQVDGPGEESKADGDRRRMLDHDTAWKDLQEFHLANGLYLGARLDRLVNDYMAGVIKAVAGWNAGRLPRGNVYDWSAAFNGLKALGETTLEQIFREVREILGIEDATRDTP